MGETRPGEGASGATAWDAFAPTGGRHAAGNAGAPPIGDGGLPHDTTTDAAGAESSGGYEGASPTGEGRAARRRQLARWKKHKRRAAAGAAFAIAGGALTVALMPDKPSASHTQAAAAPDSQRHAPTRLAATDTGSQRPETPQTHPTDTHTPTAAGGQQHINTPTAPTHRQSEAAVSRARTSPGSAPRTAPAQGTTAHTEGTATDTAATPAAETGAPAATEPPDAVTPPAAQEPAPPAAQPAGPPQLCVLGVVCIG